MHADARQREKAKCQSKRAFTTELAALNSHPGLAAYPCRWCGRWHSTTIRDASIYSLPKHQWNAHLQPERVTTNAEATLGNVGNEMKNPLSLRLFSMRSIAKRGYAKLMRLFQRT